MKIRVLGGYGSCTRDHRNSCFLIDDWLMLDGGAAASSLTLAEQAKVKAVLISHPHVDHFIETLFLMDNLCDKAGAHLELWSTEEVLAPIKKHALNDELWPDFTTIPSVDNPVARLFAMEEEKEYELNGLNLMAVRVDHVVPAVGLLVRSKSGTLIYTGNTAPTERLWEYTRKQHTIKAVLIEVSFPNRMQELATLSKHLTPQTAALEIKKFATANFPILVFHMKPAYIREIERELQGLKNKNIELIEDDKTYNL